MYKVTEWEDAIKVKEVFLSDIFLKRKHIINNILKKAYMV